MYTANLQIQKDVAMVEFQPPPSLQHENEFIIAITNTNQQQKYNQRKMKKCGSKPLFEWKDNAANRHRNNNFQILALAYVNDQHICSKDIKMVTMNEMDQRNEKMKNTAKKRDMLNYGLKKSSKLRKEKKISQCLYDCSRMILQRVIKMINISLTSTLQMQFDYYDVDQHCEAMLIYIDNSRSDSNISQQPFRNTITLPFSQTQLDYYDVDQQCDITMVIYIDNNQVNISQNTSSKNTSKSSFIETDQQRNKKSSIKFKGPPVDGVSQKRFQINLTSPSTQIQSDDFDVDQQFVATLIHIMRGRNEDYYDV